MEAKWISNQYGLIILSKKSSSSGLCTSRPAFGVASPFPYRNERSLYHPYVLPCDTWNVIAQVMDYICKVMLIQKEQIMSLEMVHRLQ